MQKKSNILVISTLLFFLLSSCSKNSIPSSDSETITNLPKMQTVDDVIIWSGLNLHYRNIDKWDAAPKIESVIDDGYGDCKMLAGVVSALLDSVGQPNEFIVIKKDSWHMFNVYERNGKLHVINNAKLVNREFRSHEEIERYFGVNKYVKVFNHYDDFRYWFNTYIYKNNR